MTSAIQTAPGPARPPLSSAGWVRAWPIYPLLLLIVAFFLYPVLQILWLSLLDRAGELSAENYVRATTTPVYARTLGITLQISAWTTIFSLLGGYPVAYLLATARPRTRDILTVLVLMPFWTSFLVRTFAWMILLGRNGAVNKLLLALGITDAPLSLIFNFTGTMIGMVHAMMPLAVMAMLSVMLRVDQTLVSAARTLGARAGSAFWQIFFRMSVPGVASAGLLVFISALGFFITPALLGGSNAITLSMLIASFINDRLAWSLAAAGSLILLVIVLALLAVTARFLPFGKGVYAR
jgi:putative spermidine/putrescine transport system permease protein